MLRNINGTIRLTNKSGDLSNVICYLEIPRPTESSIIHNYIAHDRKLALWLDQRQNSFSFLTNSFVGEFDSLSLGPIIC